MSTSPLTSAPPPLPCPRPHSPVAPVCFAAGLVLVLSSFIPYPTPIRCGPLQLPIVLTVLWTLRRVEMAVASLRFALLVALPTLFAFLIPTEYVGPMLPLSTLLGFFVHTEAARIKGSFFGIPLSDKSLVYALVVSGALASASPSTALIHAFIGLIAGLSVAKYANAQQPEAFKATPAPIAQQERGVQEPQEAPRVANETARQPPSDPRILELIAEGWDRRDVIAALELTNLDVEDARTLLEASAATH